MPTKKTWDKSSRLFCVLGPPAIVQGNKQPLKNQKAALLVTYLTVHGSTSRERLTGLLWPDLTQSKASANLRGVLHKLKSLAPGSIDAQGDQLAISPSWSVDLKMLLEATDHKQRRQAAQFRGIVCEGVSVPDCEELELWLSQIRENASQQQMDNLLELSGQWLESGSLDEAVEAARIAVSQEPHCELAHTQLIRALVAAGDRSAAIRQFRLLESVLEEEFGVKPTEETVQLLQAEPEKRTTPHNLPSPLTSFFGREEEMQAIETALREHRLVTVTGVGGVGKTQLCLNVARHWLEGEKPPVNGIWYVRLAPVRDPRFLADRFQLSIGLSKEHGPLEETLKDRECLLVVDNCERVLEECSSYIRHLLETCPKVKVLATSREPLKVPGESVLCLEPFAVPAGECELKVLAQSPVVRLLLDRGQMVDPMLNLDESNMTAALRICRELDGIPLALELAGARLGMFTLEQLADRLSDRFQLLKGRPGDETRQQTLGALLDWSYESLDEELKELLAGLSVFVGSFELSAVEEICLPDESQWEALDRLTALVEKSLVTTVVQGRFRRYKLLETVRQYARSYLCEEEKDRLWDAHLEYYLKLARRAEVGLAGNEQRRWVHRLDAEVNNMHAAVRRAGGRIHRVEGALELCLAPRLYWVIRDFRSAIRTALPVVLEEALSVGARPELVVRAYRLLGEFATDQGDFLEAEEYLLNSIEIAEEFGELEDTGHSHKALGNLHYCQSSYALAQASYLAAQKIFLSLEHTSGLNDCYNNLGLISFEKGDFERSRELFLLSLELSKQLGDERSTALSHTNLGHLEIQQGSYPEAKEQFLEAFRLYRQVHDFGYATLQTVKGLAQLALLNREWQEGGRLLALAARIVKKTRTVDIASRRTSLDELQQCLLREAGEDAPEKVYEALSLQDLLQEIDSGAVPL